MIKHAVNRDSAAIKGKVTMKVIELDDVGRQQMDQLHEEYDIKEYYDRRDLLYRESVPEKIRESLMRALREEYLEALIKAKHTVAYCDRRERIHTEHGKIKRRPRKWWQKLLGMPGDLMIVTNNIVTDEGDALIADIMSQTPLQTKVDNTNGHVDIGTGWTGTTPKQQTEINTPCTTPSTAPEVMDATYPKLKGAFGAANDNVTQYRSTFEAGDIDETGIDEAGLINNVVRGSADMLAYAQITPTVDVATTDTLQVDWELTYLGA